MTKAIIARMASETEISAKLPSAMFAALLGLFIVYGIGFAPVERAHAAAHDGRHVFSFPCD
ncbi:MAG: CbtB-domain containing protein [Rhodospirillales bacterium]|nr:CbtB-domain containing protein [Rhodospirillales bacterium]